MGFSDSGRERMVTPGSKFTRKMEEAIAALLIQRKIEDAARATGIGTQTLLRWLKVPEFDKAYRASPPGVVRTGCSAITTGH